MTVTPPAGARVGAERGDGEGNRHADGNGVRGRGDESERVAGAGVVADAAGNDGGRVEGGLVVDFDIDRAGDAGGGGRRDGGDLVGRDAGDERGLAADEHRVGQAKAHALNRDGAAGGGQARGRDGVGVEHPAVVGVVGAAVAAQVGDADAHHVVAVGGDAQPGFAGGEAVEAGRGADGRCADGIEGIPHADRGHGLGVRWARRFHRAPG